jgi:hypothetical protein
VSCISQFTAVLYPQKVDDLGMVAKENCALSGNQSMIIQLWPLLHCPSLFYVLYMRYNLINLVHNIFIVTDDEGMEIIRKEEVFHKVSVAQILSPDMVDQSVQ